MKITNLAVKKRIATSIIVIALVVLGIYGFTRLPVDFLPDITYPLIKVHIWWRGATPDEIDRNLADPIEREMATVDGIDYLESSSIEGMYTLLLNFQYGVNVDVAYQDALAAMARVARQLPKDIDPPVIIKADPSQLPVVQMTVSSERWDLTRLRTWTDNWLQDQLVAVPGVAGTEIVGGLEREIRVHLDPKAMEKYGLSLTSVLKRLKEENIEQFGGRVTSGPREFIARTVGEYRSLDQIRSVVLSRQGMAKVCVSDIATVEDAHEEVRVITRLGGQPCVKLSVLKQAEANTVEVARAISRRIKELGPAIPAGIQLGMVENQADYIESALKSVRDALIGAIILVILVLYLFLGSWRQIVVMLLALPITLICNFGLMKLAGFSLNIFSLAGLVVATGTLLDNSTVVLENITRLRDESPGLSADEVCIAGTSEVGPAVIAATLSFLALFVPFLMVPGLASLLFRELILVLAGIVTVSLLVSISVTPMLTSLLLGQPPAAADQQPKTHSFQRFFAGLTEGYDRLLSSMLHARWLVVLVFVLILAVAIALVPRLGSEFLPKMDDGRVMVKVKLPTGAAVGETAKILSQIEARLSGDPLIESYFTLAGGKVWGLYTYEIANEGEIDIQLVPQSKRKMTTVQFIKRLRPAIAKIPVPGGKAMVKQMKVKGIRKIGESDIEVEVHGQDIGELFHLAKKVSGVMNRLAHLTNVYVSMDMTKPEYQVEVDRVRAAELGVSVTDVASTVRSLVGGAVATQYRDGDEYYNIRVMIPEKKITSRHDLEHLVLDCAQGGHLYLSDVAQVKQALGPVEIVRQDQVKEVIVRGDVVGASVGQILKELKKELNSLDRPVGYEFFYGGQAQMMSEMKHTVLIILAFALFFAFAVLAVQFNDLELPALIIGSVPFCLAGMVCLLYCSTAPLGATVIIGLLVVVAATVNDGVLLLEFAGELKKTMPPFEAVLTAAKIRLRPRVMTTLTTIVGFLPLALNIGEGGDMLKPMAIAAIGGLSMEVFVALFLMPCLYLIFTRENISANIKQ